MRITIFGFLYCFLITLFLGLNVYPSIVRAAPEPISVWSTDTSLPYEISSHFTLVTPNKINIITGSAQTFNSHDDIIYSSPNSSGLLSSWQYLPNKYPVKMIWGAGAENGIYHYGLGGYEEYSSSSRYSNQLVYYTSDSLSWTATTVLPTRLSKGAAAIVGNYIYFSGGFTDNENAGSASKKVYYAPINSNGSLGNWNTTTNLPDVLWAHGMVAYGNYIYVIGGWNSSGITNQVWRAMVNSDGTLGVWSAMPNLPTPNRSMGTVLVDNYIFVVGGFNGNLLNSVYYTSLSANGTMASWQASANSLPSNHCCGSLAAVGGYLYLTGGYTNNYENRVWKAKLNLGTQSLTPTIVLPGMGGSWNYEAIVHNTAVADTSWTLTPSVTVYDGLITTLKNSGYTEGTNLWVYYYDWRKNISDTATNLANFIASKNLSSLNLIGHSQGGLIARKYAQDNSSKINKLVTIASPHSGALPAFKVWTGADFSDIPAWQNLLIKLYLRINRKSYDNDVKTIQAMFPNLQNILPTFEYFSSGTGPKSNFLQTLTTDSLYTITGASLNSPQIYTISARNSFDKLLGKWVSGKPTGATNASGDGTVLLTSGQIINALENSSQNNQDHQAIVSNSTTLSKIQSILGISGTVSSSSQDSLANALIITAASPVNFTVTTPSTSILTPTDNLLIVNNPADGNYTVNVTPSGAGGAYTIYFGKTKGSDWAWEEATSTITSGTKTHVFGVQMSQAGLGSNPLANALNHNNDALVAVGSNTILKQDVLRIKSYINDLNTAAANILSGFDLRAGRLFSAIDTLIIKAKNTTITQSLRLIKSDIEQLRGDRFGN